MENLAFLQLDKRPDTATPWFHMENLLNVDI